MPQVFPNFLSWISILPSHTHIRGLKPFAQRAQGTWGRMNAPHVSLTFLELATHLNDSWRFLSYVCDAKIILTPVLEATWGWETENVRATWGRANVPHVPQALYTKAFEIGMWVREGHFRIPYFFTLRDNVRFIWDCFRCIWNRFRCTWNQEKSDARSNGSLWIVQTDSFHGANPTFHESWRAF